MKTPRTDLITRTQYNICRDLDNGWKLYHSWHCGTGEVLCRPRQAGIGSRPYLVRLSTFKAMLRRKLIAQEGTTGPYGAVYGPGKKWEAKCTSTSLA